MRKLRLVALQAPRKSWSSSPFIKGEVARTHMKRYKAPDLKKIIIKNPVALLPSSR
jgi:hypothetical protein